MSNLSDSAYTSNFGETGRRGQVSMKMKNMAEQPENPANNGDLIHDILQAFVGVVNAQGSRQVPVYLPPQYLSQFAGQVPGPTQPVNMEACSVCVCVCV